MARKKKEVTLEDCVLEALSLQAKLQTLYSVSSESGIYSEIIVLDQLIRNLTNKIKK